jgi:hypothetical protein
MLLNYQGRVSVGSVNFTGTGQFKFALTNAAGTVYYWTNDGTGSPRTPPTNAVSISVNKGLYSVLLGDTTPSNMTALPVGTIWANPDIRLRVFFSDGVNGFQQFTPDQRLAPAGYLADGIFLGTRVTVEEAMYWGKYAASRTPPYKRTQPIKITMTPTT